MTVVLDELDLAGGIDFFTPFTPSTSADIAAPSSQNTLPISLGGRDYVIDLDQYARQSLDPFRQAQDTSKEPGEQTLTVAGVWKRTQLDWRLGAGQEFADDEDSDRTRFWESEHVDVWTRRRACLLHDTDEILDDTTTLLMYAGRYVYAYGGGTTQAAELVNDGDLPAPTWVNQVTATTVLDFCTDGDHVFYACGSGHVRKGTVGTPGSALLDDGGGATSAASITATGIWFVNGWLLVSEGEKLYTVSAGGTKTLIYTHFNASWKWVSATGAPNGIYILGHNSTGTLSNIYRISIDEAGGTLNVPVFAGDLPIGETGRALLYYQQRVMIGTDRGFRAAGIGSNGDLAIGPVRLIGEIVDFAAHAEFVYAAGTPGLYRIDISRETDNLVPAYAADLEASTGSSDASAVCSTPMGPVFVDGTVWAASTTRYCEEGTLRSGWFGMNSPERKVLASGGLRAEPLPNTATIEMEVEDDAGTFVSIGTLETAGTRDPGVQWDGQSLDSEFMRVQITLRATEDLLESPCIRRHTIRIVPAPDPVEEILVPILMGDKVQAEGGPKVSYVPYDEFRFLKTLEVSRQVVNYREGQATYRVTVRSITIQKPDRWSNRRGFFNSVILVKLQTVEGIPPLVGSP